MKDYYVYCIYVEDIAIYIGKGKVSTRVECLKI